jgi:hypothetical protein
MWKRFEYPFMTEYWGRGAKVYIARVIQLEVVVVCQKFIDHHFSLFWFSTADRIYQNAIWFDKRDEVFQ